MISGLIRLRAADGDDDVATVGELDVGPAQNPHLAAAQRPVKEQRHDHGVDEAAPLGRLGALEAGVWGAMERKVRLATAVSGVSERPELAPSDRFRYGERVASQQVDVLVAER